MIEPKGVVHFSIAVSDLEASRKFYTEILGLTLIQSAPASGMVFLRAGKDHVILARSDAPLKRDPKDSRRAHHAFKVDSEKYERAKAFLAAKGVEVFEEEVIRIANRMMNPIVILKSSLSMPRHVLKTVPVPPKTVVP